ncbi:MAG: alpha-L-fucosidase [Bacteroidales bacterium]
MKINLFKQFIIMSLLTLVISITATAQNDHFKPTDESLKQYQYPDWFRDAKFGIWSCWGPQAVPRQGDWYARRMYQVKDPAYKYHLEHYGHPSVFGYKDIIPLWKAEKWDPDKLMALYKKAGAKYFVVLAVHHDNFFLWDSKLNDWNSVNMGPKKDVVKIWQQVAKKQGLRFGVSEHLGASYTWFQVSHGADKEGPKAGVPYDGADMDYQDLYHAKTTQDNKDWLTKNPAFQLEWYKRIKELVDNYQPDLLYSDSKMPFEDVGRTLISHFYNQDIIKNNGKLEAVYNCKQPSEGMWIEDLERGVKDTISQYPWQTDTSIGDWYYRTGQKYKTATEVIKMLVDIVSMNGNLLINVVQTPEGDLEPDMIAILEEIGAWTEANGEGIYGSRPWKIYGERPTGAQVVKSGNFNEEKVKYSAGDVRFTTKGSTLYAYCLGKPETDIIIKSLGKSSKLEHKAIASITLLGSSEKIEWKYTSAALVIKKPVKMPGWQVLGFKIELKK